MENQKEEFSKSIKLTVMKEGTSLELLIIRIYTVLTSIYMKTTTADGKDNGKNQILLLGCGTLDGEAGNMTSFLEKFQPNQTLSNG